jgi:hypothetical protein
MVNKLLGLPTNTAHTSELQQSDTVQPQLQRDALLSSPGCSATVRHGCTNADSNGSKSLCRQTRSSTCAEIHYPSFSVMDSDTSGLMSKLTPIAQASASSHPANTSLG